MRPVPPRLFLRFFRWFCHPKLRDGIEGDLMEVYYERASGAGKRRADFSFIKDIILLFRPGIIRPITKQSNTNTLDMYKNYFKVAFRILRTNKGFSFINISGLAIGMATAVVIMLYVLDEMAYDKHHVDGHLVYRIAAETNNEKWTAQAAPMADALKSDFPEVEESTRLLRFPGAEKMLLRDEETHKQFFETNAFYVDSSFFRLFTYDFKFGDARTALSGSNSIVVAEKVAQRFFGEADPVGKVIKVSLPFGDFNYTINGVFRDNGKKSHIPTNLLLSMNNGDIGGWVKAQTKWSTNSIFHTYVKLKSGTDAHTFESKLNGFLNRHGGEEFKAAGHTKTLFIQPLEDIYLQSNFGYEVGSTGNIKYLYIFTSIAAFILLIACINFMNLSTSRSEKRAREVGLRKAIGAERRSLVGQFLSESVFMSLLALVLAFLLVQLTLPLFNDLIDKDLSLIALPNVYTWLIVLTLGTGIVSGLYPAFYLSSFKPISVLKGKMRNDVSAVMIRKGLVIFQFMVSLVLILGAIVISQQMNFLQHQSLGFKRDQQIILPLQTNQALANRDALTNALTSNSQVVSVAKAGTYPGIESITSMLFYAEGKPANDNVDIQTAYAESGYLKTLGIKLLDGRDFSTDIQKEQGGLILNESAIKSLGYKTEDAVGRKIYFEFQGASHAMEIIGVVKDYHFQSLHQKIKPQALAVAPLFSGPTLYLILNVKTSAYSEILSSIQNTWTKINPDSPFAYSFLDQDFERNYQKEYQTSQLIRSFTIIAVLIACLGLFGLATFTAEQRTKEIGVRKVMGASALQIVSLLSKDFLKLVMIAIVLSSPIAYYAVENWLQGFAYRIGVSWWIFIAAGFGAVLIALLTIGYQAIRAAVVSPVKSLRSNE